MTRSTSDSENAVSQLCPNCGLCCNGVLFADVELQPGDNGPRLLSLGLELARKGKKLLLPQPCSCFDGKLCTIYGDRPLRCRAFECGLLQRAQTGAITTKSALTSIKEARRCAERVRGLVRQMGECNEDRPLNWRYQEVLAQPIDLEGDRKLVRLRARLMRSVTKLVHLLERDFLRIP